MTRGRVAGSLTLLAVAGAAGCAGGDTPIDRAVAFLSAEVPAWPAEHGCFSCHHNGDAARALFTAERGGRIVPHAALESTLGWLSEPRGWDHQKGDPAFENATLARLQFTAAFAAAVEAGLVRERAVIDAAGDAAAAIQGADGAWTIDTSGAIGSPATWGTHLATALTVRALETLDAGRFSGSIERARAWLRDVEPQNVLEAAAAIHGLAGTSSVGASRQVERCLRVLEEGRALGGGWGPYTTSPREPFDTAVVLLALSRLRRSAVLDRWMRDGAAFLIAWQEEYGGWPATTRPRGGVSYAQATSTSAWAAMALMATEGVASAPYSGSSAAASR